MSIVGHVSCFLVNTNTFGCVLFFSAASIWLLLQLALVLAQVYAMLLGLVKLVGSAPLLGMLSQSIEGTLHQQARAEVSQLGGGVLPKVNCLCTTIGLPVVVKVQLCSFILDVTSLSQYICWIVLATEY